MRRILVVDDDPLIGLAIRAWLKRYGFRVSIADGGSNGLAALALDPVLLRMAARLGARRCLRKPFRPTTLPGGIDECLSEAEPPRGYVATLAAIANALSEPQGKMKSSDKFRGQALAV